jgi:predicted 2-oxoglutarate/Fe(II)-dependent dioxygenase YbiX
VCGPIVRAYDEALTAGLQPKGGPGKTDVGLEAFWPDANVIVNQLGNAIYYHLIPNLKLDYCAFTTLSGGSYHELHADSVRLDGGPNHTPDRVAAVVLFLCDARTDFDGGVLYFPELGVEIAPLLLTAFPSDLAHQHEVSRVTRGRRDAIVTSLT